jgi:hypothetical protein
MRAMSDAEADAVMKRRLCIRSFPWTDAQSESLEAGDFPAAPEIAALRAEMRSTAQTLNRAELSGQYRGREFDEVVARLEREDWFDGLPRHMKIHSIRLAQGLDPMQADAYATWLYCRQLAKSGDWATVHRELRGMDRSRRLRPIDFTSADESTYFSQEFLDAELSLLAIEARARSARSASPEDVIDLLAYQDAPREQLAAFGFGRDDISALLENRAAQFVRSQRSADTIPNVIGTSELAGEKVVYVRLNSDAPTRAFRIRAQRVELLGPQEALRTFEAKVAADLRTAGDSIRLTNVMRDGDGFILELAEQTIRIDAAEYAQIRNGQRLSSTHPVSRLLAEDRPLVIYSNALMRRQKGFLADAEELGFALQNAYPEASVLRDDYSPETALRAEELRNMPPIRTRDVVVVIDGGSFGVDDRNLMADLAPRLQSRHVKVMEYEPTTQWTGRRKRAVIVITGHIDEKLTAFVRELGAKGFFRDNYVMLNSCYTEASTGLIAEINQKYGARATLRHEGAIAPYRVGDFTMGLVDDITRHGESERLQRLVSRRMRAMSLRALWIICRAGGRDGTVTESDTPAAGILAG